MNVRTAGLSGLAYLASTGTSLAWAATSTGSSQPAGAGLFVMLGLVYLTRRRPIGGWLLYFYVQLYLGAAIALLMTAANVGNFAPSKWDSASLYVWFLLSTVPQVTLLLWLAVAGTILQARRGATNLEKFRTVTTAYLAGCAVGFAIDCAYFREEAWLFTDGFALFLAIVWFFYFRRSARVTAVFVRHDWNYAAYEALRPPPLTSAEVRYTQKRALFFGAVTFVGLLIVMGESWKGPPDASMLMLPFAYGLVAAGFGRYMPIRRSKRAQIASAHPSPAEPTA